MTNKYLALYDALIDGVKSDAPVLETVGGECWAMCAAAEGAGILIVCAGTDGQPSADDLTAAGAIIDAVRNFADIGEDDLSDMAIICENNPHIITCLRPKTSANSPEIALDTQRDNPASAIINPAVAADK